MIDRDLRSKNMHGMIGYLESLPEDFIMSERLPIRQEEPQSRLEMQQSRQGLPLLSLELPWRR